MSHSVSTKINDQLLTIETGKVAKQADGAVVVRYGGTTVLSTVVAAREPVEGRGRDFLPLTVEYRERAYAGGRIPGGFFKREGRPDEKETLTSRLIDRPMRPLFAKGFRHEIQVINLVVSADSHNDPDVLAMIGSSAAVALSGLPFNGPFGAVRVARVGGVLIVNPTYSQAAEASLELVVAGTDEAILMVEAGAREATEEQMLEALAFAHDHCRQITRLQRELMDRGSDRPGPGKPGQRSGRAAHCPGAQHPPEAGACPGARHCLRGGRAGPRARGKPAGQGT
jgi:polyribonucleotide nucleotidyltransferase